MNGDDKKPKTMVPGMNLLDYFAAQALASIATDFRFPAEAAAKAYQYAEAMVAEKNKEGQGMRYSAKEAVATICGVDIAEMNDYRYQPTMWSMPLWDFGKNPYTARKIGSKKKPVNSYDRVSYSPYDWKVVGTWQTWEVLEGTDVEEDAA